MNFSTRFLSLITLLSVIVIALSMSAFGQTAGDYRSLATGNWNATATWERYSGTAWVAATATPTSSDGVITIRNGHIVTITATVTYDQVVVEAGGQVTVASTITSTLANGADAFDLQIFGTWLNSGGTWTTTGAAWKVFAGGTFIHNTTSGISTPLGVATLDAASNFIYRGSSTLQPAVSLSGRTYGNLIYESSSGAWSPSAVAGGTAVTINGNLDVGGAGAGTVTLTHAGATSALTINGNLITRASCSYIPTTGTLTLAGNITNNGTFTPNATASFILNGTTTLTGTTSFAFTNGFTVNAGKTFQNSITSSASIVPTGKTATINGTFQINQGSWTGSNGTWTYGAAGTLVFNNTSGVYGPIDAGHVYWPGSNNPVNVIVLGGVTAGINLSVARTISGVFTVGGPVQSGNNYTVSGTCRIISGGYFDGNAPIYSGTATLEYSNVTGFGVGPEWTAGTTVGLGVPSNVTLTNSSVNMPAADRYIPGTLSISSGSILSLNATTGDLHVSGNWSNAGTFTHNNRAVWFEGGNAQTITNANGENFAYLLINKSANNLYLGNDATVTFTAGDGLQFLNAGGLSLNGKTLTLAGSGGNINVTGGARTIFGIGSLTLTGTKGINSVSSGSLIIANGSTITLSAGLTNADYMTVTGTLQINSGGYVNGYPTYTATTSLLKYNTNNVYGRGNEWSNTAPAKVQLSNNTILNYPNGAGAIALTIAGPLTIDAGSAFYMDYGQPATGVGALTVNNSVYQYGALSLGNTPGGDLNISGSYTRTGTFQPNGRWVIMGGSVASQITGPTTFDNFRLWNANGLILNDDIVINDTLSFVNGLISTGTHKITRNSWGVSTGVGASKCIFGTEAITVPGSGSPSFTFILGDGSRYSPVQMTLNNVTAGGTITATTTFGAHPQIATATQIVPSKIVNRYWTMTNSGVAFSNYNATFNFVAGEVLGGGSTAQFVVGDYDGSSWSYPTVGTKTATSTQITGATAFSDFAIGEQLQTWTLTVNTANGTVAKSPDQANYNNGTTVTLTPTPSAHYHFVNWTGNVPSGHETDNPLSITMDANKTITATFTQDEYTLGFTYVGNGTATASPAGPYHYGDVVTLTPTADPGWTFSSFSPASPVTITGNTTVTATFTQDQYTLTVNAVDGSVTKDPDVTSYSYGSTVQLTPNPNSGYAFVNWTGDVPAGHETDNPLSITMDANKSITANFTLLTFTITPSYTGNAIVLPMEQTVVSYGGSFRFTYSGNLGYVVDSVVIDGVTNKDSLSGYTFTNVTANHTFLVCTSLPRYTLTTSTVGNGTVTKSPDQADYNINEPVILTAAAGTGYEFAGWSGNVPSGSEMTNPLTLTVDGNKHLTATFTAITFTITPSYAGNVTIEPMVVVSVPYGGSQRFTYTLAPGYQFDSIVVDGVPNVDSASAYTFYIVTANHAFTVYSSPIRYTITVTTTGAGTTTKTPDQETYGYLENVSLNAKAGTGYHFDHWSGDVPSGQESLNPMTVTMDGNKTITAVFIQDIHFLYITATNGTVTKSPDQGNYTYGATVALTPAPSAGYQFVNWTGDVPAGHESDNPLTITMDGDKSITANFTAVTYTLNVTSAHGTITKNPDQSSYTGGTSITLTAAPAPGWRFTAWSGDLVSTNNPETFVIGNNMNVTANYAQDEYTVTATADNGTVTTSPEKTTYTYGDTVIVTSIPAPGYHFVSWMGDVPTGHESDNPLSVTMDGNKTLHATVTLYYYPLNLSVVGSGAATKMPDLTEYPHGDMVTIEATPAIGWHFTGWSGEKTGTTNPDTVTMTSARNITANFAIDTYSLYVSATNGTVSKSPDMEVYEFGAEVTLTAMPDAGYHFVQWTGDVPPTGGEFANPLVLTMNGNKSVTAVFAIDQFSIAYGAVNGMIWPGQNLPSTRDVKGKTSTGSGDTLRVDFGANQPFNYEPYTFYHFDSVVIDGVPSIEYPTSFTFFNVQANHTIMAYFSVTTWTLTVDATNGEVTKTPDQPEYENGAGVELMAAPHTGYHFTGWTGDVPPGYEAMNPLPITMDANKTITANFAIDTFTITASALNGTINPNGETTVDFGANQPFSYAPTTGYKFDSIVVDGVTILDSTSSYSFYTVTSPHRITAYFSVIPNFTLTVTTDNGTITKSPDQTDYTNGTLVTLTSVPATGYHFVNWTGDVPAGHETDNPLTITMDGNKTLHATVTLYYYPLNLSVLGSGTATKMPDLTEYPHGDIVNIEASPATGWHFTGWSGDKTGTTNPDTVVMTSARNITANFAANPFIITTIAGPHGHITPAGPVEVNPGGMQQFYFTPDQGYRIDSVLVDEAPTYVDIQHMFSDVQANHTLRVVFAPLPVITAAAVNGTITPSGSFQVTYYHATQQFTYAPNSGYHFDSVVVDGVANIDSTSSYTFYDVTADHAITAYFSASQFTVTATANNGSVTMDPPGGSYAYGQQVILTASPQAGYHFVNWTGDVTGTANPDTIIVTGSLNVTANFAINTYTLNMTATNGTVALNPPTGPYPYGTYVKMTATANSGYRFTGWTGDLVSSNNPDSILMDGNKSVTANFTPIVYSFRSRQSGVWADTSTWESNDGTGWSRPAVHAPSSTDGDITIQSGHWVAIAAAVTADQLTIASGGTLSDSVGVLTIANGTGTDLTINGLFRCKVSSSPTLASSATIVVNGTYEHAYNGGTVPSGTYTTWNDGSTFLITGPTGSTSSISGTSNHSFYNVTFNCTGLTTSFNLSMVTSGGTATIRGDLTLLSTSWNGSTGKFRPISGGTGTTYKDVVINGNLNVLGSQSYFETHGTASSNLSNLTVKGTVKDSAGSMSMVGAASPVYWYINGDFIMNGGTLTKNSSATDCRIYFNKAGSQTFRRFGTSPISGNMAWYVNSGATLVLPTDSDSLSSTTSGHTFTVNAGAGLACGAAAGVNGNIKFTGTKTFSTAADYSFIGTAPQVTGSLLPATVNNLTLNNIYGVTLTNNAMVNGTLAFQNGKLTTGANAVTLGPTGAVTGAGSSMYVDGNEALTLPSTGSPTVTYDIGDASNYTPVQIAFNTLSSGGTLLANTTAGAQANLGSSLINASKTVNRYYSFTNSGVASTDYAATFNYGYGDIIGGANPYNFIVGKYNSGWTYPTVGGKTSNSTQVIGVTTGFSDFAIGEALPTYTLNVISDHGTVTVNPPTGPYLSGTQVQLNAVAEAGYTFTGWSGDVLPGYETMNPLTITMDANKTITANYSINTYPINITFVGNGTVAMDPPTGPFAYGAPVLLTATAANGYTFVGWSGDTTTSANPITVTMYSAKNITATFSSTGFSVTLGQTANGTITKTPDQGLYPIHAVVSLTATPDPGYHFTGWTGALSGTMNPDSVYADSNMIIGATFEINTYSMTLNADHGTATVDPPTGPYNHGMVVVISAAPYTGYHFVNWTGDHTGTTNPDTVLMNGDKTITANFAIDQFTIASSVVNGTITPTPSATVDFGANQQFTYAPNAGYHFDSIMVDGVKNIDSISSYAFQIVTAGHGIVAYFSINTYTLAVDPTIGTVAKSPDQPLYNHGTSVALTPTAPTGYHFVNWTGDFPSGHAGDNPLSLVMDANKSLTANFAHDVVAMYQSHQTGNWNDVNTWEQNTGTEWTWPATGIPSYHDSTIEVLSGHTVTVNIVADTVDQFTIDAGGQVTVAAGDTLFIANGAGTDLTLNGTLLNNTKTALLTGATATVSGTYQHNINGGTIPAATWQTGSTCLVTGVVATAPSGANQDFYNFTWNCPSQTGNLNLGWHSRNVTIAGTFSALANNWDHVSMSTGNNQLRFFGGTGAKATINNLVVSGPKTYLTTAGSSYIDTVVVNGNVTVSGGAAMMSGNNSTASMMWFLKGNLTIVDSGYIAKSTAANLSEFVFCGTGTQVVSIPAAISNSTYFFGSPNFVDTTGATVDMGTSAFAGSGSFRVRPGATLISAHPSGINGNILMSGTNGGGNVFSTTANYTFNGAAAQVTGAMLPATVNNLTINNAAGVTLTGNTTVNGALTFTNGILATGSNSVTLGATGTVVGANSSKYVNGAEAWTLPASGSPTTLFDIGDASNYTPVTVALNTLTQGGTLTARSTAGTPGNLGTSTINSAKIVNRAYALSNNGLLFTDYNATFNYVAADVIGSADPNNFIVGKYSAGSWTYPTVGTKTATSTQITGATSFSDFVIGEPVQNWTLTVTAYNGTVTKSPDQTSYTNGTMVTLTPVAATGYHFSQWTGDASGSANPLSVTMDANKTIGAIFSIDTLTITTEAGPNGTIYPGGPVSVTYGSGMQFYITASPGYHVDSLFVDGVPQTPGPMYMFTNITANHTIRATFAVSGFSIMASAGENGAISPTGEVFVQTDSNQTFTITPNTGYHVDSLFIDGEPQTPAVVYNFLTVEANHTIHVTFAIDQELIEASAGPNGSIAPDGKTYLSYGGTQEYIFTPASGYHADSLFIDGEGQLAPASYTFTNVTTNHTIHVTFAINNYTVTVEAQNGTVALSPIRESYQYGDTVRLTPTPLTGYHFMHWSGQDVPQGHETDIPLVIVMDASKSITATFAIDTFAIVATNGAHGTIAPSGTTNVTYGGSQAYTLTPDLGYHVDSLVVDDTARIAGTSYEFTNVTANHTIYAAFARNTYSITTSAGANGAVAPLGEQKVYHGDTLVVAITPDAGYHVDSLIIDGVNQSAATSFTFANITVSHTLRATFAIDQYTITAASGPNGTVTPAGVTSVSYNGSQAYSITPSTGYHIDSFFIDGVSSTVVTGYTFTGVTANHTIRATFAINTFTITATSGANGSIDPQGAVSVNYGASRTFTFTPVTGYHVDSVLVDGASQTPAASYAFTNVTANHTIRVVFKINSYTITATSGANGTVTPAGVTTLEYNHSQAYTITPATGYTVDSLFIDGVGITVATGYTFSNVAANHTIRASFAIITYPITVTATGNGTITPSGVVQVSYNGTQTFSIHPLTGYHIASVTVDGSPVAVDTSYTFHNVLAPHTIAATFAINTYDITATLATSNGTIDPSGTITVNYGVDTTFRIVPNKGYEVDSLYIDGVGQDIADSGSVESYTFPAVAENHTIRVVFDVLPLYRIQYRTFKYDSLCVQNAMRKRNVSEECQFTITNTTSGTVTEINMYFGFNITSVLQSGPMTATGARKIWKFTGSFPAGQSFNLKVMVPSTSKQKIARMWFGPAKGTPNVLNLKPYATQLLLKMPNAANVRDTLWALPQYILDGFTVGVTKRDSAESYGWVVMRSRYDMFRSWYFSRKKHTDINVGFLTFTKNAEPFTKEHKELPPSRQNNKTFADLVSLKFSLALSQHGIAPSGLGELRYTEPGNPFAGMLVREIAALGDTMMTLAKWDRWHSHQDLYGKLDTALIHINGAFSGSIDTVTWSTHLKLTGCARVIDQIYLEPTGLPPTVATQSYAGNVAVPRKAELHQNYPNPFNPTTTIRFQLPEDGLVTLKVYNILGQEVATLVNHEEMTAGSSEVDFNAGRYASGVYFYRLKVEPIVEEDGTTTGQYFNMVKKMMLVK